MQRTNRAAVATPVVVAATATQLVLSTESSTATDDMMNTVEAGSAYEVVCAMEFETPVVRSVVAMLLPNYDLLVVILLFDCR